MATRTSSERDDAVSELDELADDARPDRRRDQAIEAMPGLARIAGSTWLRGAVWGAETSVRTGLRIARRLPGGDLAARVVEEAAEQARRSARQVLGVEDVEERLRKLVPERVGSARSWTPTTVEEPLDPSQELRARGAGLLAQAANVAFQEDAHPAYARILDELTPDEARVLRLLATRGAQPAIDVRTGRPLGIGSELIAAGLTIIGAEAGCRYVERVPAYLNNLFRLGLIWFSHEELQDLRGYQVLEAQPEVKQAMREAGRAAKTIRRSIALTPFGDDFCRICLPLDGPTPGFTRIQPPSDQAGGGSRR
ncbi:DUF4393 domain-containing protein [Patulibacter defluvii]|uniref:DUF4393 domain-containing protein n=1 Tax=Patulibacter defluvii TaxID=3095358 RepID=UPI002A7588A8|nr:DUF4393 domain-containing protein [Patulibacter sp. DM4]